jgi:hypothetical protein
MERAKIIKNGNMNLEQIHIGDILSFDIEEFIEWLYINDLWHFDKHEKVWKNYGHRSRTTQELFNFYKSNNK